jgi:hypothetical protein
MMYDILFTLIQEPQDIPVLIVLGPFLTDLIL